MESLTPLPLGSEIHGFSLPMTLAKVSNAPAKDYRVYSHDVGLTSGELVVNGVLQVDNIETAVVALTVSDDTDTTHVATTSDHDDNAGVELDEVGDLASGQVDLDGVVDLDGGVGVADPTQNLASCMTSPDPGLMPGDRGCPQSPSPHLDQRLIEAGTYVRASCVTK